jgi:hypothetical protein
MKKPIEILRLVLPFLILSYGCSTRSGNLLVNGNAEAPKYDSVPKGWQNIAGMWTSLEGDSTHHDYGFAKEGKYYFFGVNGLLCVLQQDADVHEYANRIDDGKQQFVVNGSERSLDQGQLSDQGMVKFECLDITKTKILYSDSTDTLMSIGKWRTIVDTFSAPKSTRYVRVQLIAFRNVGGDNDGYFDDISLIAPPSTNNSAVIIIAVFILAIMVGVIVYAKKKSKK